MKVVEKFAEFFQESNGGSSSVRLQMLITTVGVVLIWGFVAIWQVMHAPELKDIPDIPWGVVTFALGIVGLKVYQKDKEGTTAMSSEKTTTTTEATVVTPQETPK